MRIIFIPGFGEDEKIFSKLLPYIPGEKLVLDSWNLTGDTPAAIDVLKVAQALITQYGIRAGDVVIGHSMGGWIAYHIKHCVHCRIVQIASWTDPAKVVLPVSNPNIIYRLIKSGLYLNSFVKWCMLQLYYRNRPSREIFGYIFNKLIKGNKDNIVNQLKIILIPLPLKINIQPDLRIHAREDRIIKFPDEPFIEVPGDHFTLYTHPDVIYPLLLSFLDQ